MRTGDEGGQDTTNRNNRAKQPNKIWKNGTFILSLLSCQIFFHWKESPEVGILNVFIVITCLFKNKKTLPLIMKQATSCILSVIRFTVTMAQFFFIWNSMGGREGINQFFFLYSVKSRIRKYLHQKNNTLPFTQAPTERERERIVFVV
jgi:predicted small integral membrane protein